MKTLAIVAVILILTTAAGRGVVGGGVSTLGAAIGKLMPSQSSGDEQDGDHGGGEP
jgi:hypothetical protein